MATDREPDSNKLITDVDATVGEIHAWLWKLFWAAAPFLAVYILIRLFLAASAAAPY